MSLALTSTWHRSAEEIDPTVWNRLVGQDKSIKSLELLRAVESSQLEDIEYLYLSVRSQNTTVLTMGCFVYSIKLDTLSGHFLQKFSAYVRRFWSSFLKVRVFFLGTPIAICDHLFGIDEQLGEMDRCEVLEFTRREILARARLQRSSLIVLKDIPAHQERMFKDILGSQYCFAESLPNAYVPIEAELSPYPKALKKNYRYRIKAAQKQFKQAEFRWTRESHFSIYAERMCELYLQVLNRSDVQFERLTPEFFRRIEIELRDRVFSLICRNRKGEIVCFELILIEDRSLVPLYLGMDYLEKDEGQVYFNCLYRIIEEAETMGKEWVVLGQTSYFTKALTGAFFERLYMGVLAPNPVINQFVRRFKSLIFPSTPLPDLFAYKSEHSELLDKKRVASGLDFTSKIPLSPDKLNRAMNHQVISTDYSPMASFYNGITSVISQGGNSRSQQAFLKWVEPHHQVLNIGCGSVQFNTDLAQCSSHVTSIDISKKMIDQAQIRFSKLQVPPVNFVCTDIMQYSAPQQYDIVFSNFFLNTFHWSDCKVVIEKISSLVKDQGILCIADETTGSKTSTRFLQGCFRPPIIWLHHKWANHPQHKIYDYTPILKKFGFTLKESKRDKSDYILSSVYIKNNPLPMTREKDIL